MTIPSGPASSGDLIRIDTVTKVYQAGVVTVAMLAVLSETTRIPVNTPAAAGILPA